MLPIKVIKFRLPGWNMLRQGNGNGNENGAIGRSFLFKESPLRPPKIPWVRGPPQPWFSADGDPR